MKEYLTIDVFVDSGIRVSGKQQAGLLSLLSGDALSASKHIDERGWYLMTQLLLPYSHALLGSAIASRSSRTFYSRAPNLGGRSKVPTNRVRLD